MRRPIECRARRLVALYPQQWRDRFGDELEQLMIDEMRERRSSLSRDGDVVVHALLAHLAGVGLAGGRLTSRAQAERALRLLGVLVVLFFTLGVGMWSQLAVGWAWATPTMKDTRIAMAVMSVALIGLAVVLVLAASLVLVGVARAAARRTLAPLWPLLAAIIGVAALIIGCWHVGAQWPDAGWPQWGRHSIVPAALARVGWAGTLFINADWVHPGALLRLAPGRLGWMIASPLMLAVVLAGAVVGLRRLQLPGRVVRVSAALAVAGVALGCVFVAAAAGWILNAGLGPRHMFAPGAVDCIGLVSLAAALLVTGRLTRRSLDAALAPLG